MRLLKPEINNLVQSAGIPTLTMPSGASMVAHNNQNYFGVHAGPVGQIDTMPLMNSVDLVIAFGPMFSDTQTLGWSIVPSTNKTITITKNSISFQGSKSPVSINARSFLAKLADHLKTISSSRPVPGITNFRAIRPPPLKSDDPINQDSLYLRLNPYLRPNDIILIANATPIIGGRDFILPPNAQVIASGLWFSIGHMLPASLGAALAQKSRPLKQRGRTILFKGDGSFQVTAQEVSTIIRYKLDVTIFIVNNGGYAYERHIHGMEEDYNDIPPWRYVEAPMFFGAKGDGEYPVESYVVRTWGDLERLINNKRFCEGRGLKVVELVVGKYDVPRSSSLYSRQRRRSCDVLVD
jgi:pyruvate decarboxylase